MQMYKTFWKLEIVIYNTEKSPFEHQPSTQLITMVIETHND